jgi:D-threonate/D-erythronate kinase
VTGRDQRPSEPRAGGARPDRAAAAPLLAVVGDDLSGVVSVSGELASRGLATVLPTGTKSSAEHLLEQLASGPESGMGTVIAVTTDSRHDPPDVAREKVLAASRALSGVAVLVKKVDSLLRGNIGPELAAAMEGSGSEVALCVFAAPSQGRTTVGSTQLLNGEPVGQNDPGSYLRFGSRGANIMDLLQEDFGDRVRSLHLDVVRRGKDAIREELDALLDDSPAVVVCDATEVGHVADCVAAAISRGIRLLVGTSDLCGAVADALVAEGHIKAGLPVLIVSGTASRAGRLQVEDVASEGAANLLEVPVEATRAGNVEEYVSQAATLLGAGENVLVCPERPPTSGEKVEASPAVARVLAEVGVGALRRSRVCGVVATGGETAEAMLNQLDAEGLVIGRDVIPGVPEAVILGGPHAGLRFVAKTGAYGGHDALRKIAEWLRSCNELFDSSVGRGHGALPTKSAE